MEAATPALHGESARGKEALVMPLGIVFCAAFFLQLEQ